MKHGSLFSGGGGFDLAAEWAGWENVFHCEINPLLRKVLAYYWPASEAFEDITKTDFSKYYGTVDIISGGFPCQPFSVSGKRKGTEDQRNLWPYMFRAIQQVRPRWVLAENVPGLVNWSHGLVFEQVQIDLENEGYETAAFILPASSSGAPHRRDRVYIVAYRDRNGRRKPANATEGKQHGKRRDALDQFNAPNGGGNVTNAADEGLERKPKKGNAREKRTKLDKRFNFGFFDAWKEFPTQWPVLLGNDGISAELDGITVSKLNKAAIEMAGNAVVPQIIWRLFDTINEYEKQNNL